MKKSAIITGLTGQDGSFLAELLLEKGYDVIGVARRSSTDSFQNVKHLLNDIKVEVGDLTDGEFISKLVSGYRPNEFYNLGAQSFVPVSWKMPQHTAEVNALGPLRILEAIKNFSPDTRFYQASTSEMFGKVREIPQNEETPFYPRSPYGVSKVYGHWITVNYRESYNLFACSGILFNHESILKNSPVIIRGVDGNIDILPIEDMFKSESHRYEGLRDIYSENEVWNGVSWTNIVGGSCYKDVTKRVKLVQTREACYESTLEHHAFLEDDSEKETDKLLIGEKLFSTEIPYVRPRLTSGTSLARFIGFVVGDGHISKDGKIRLTGTDRDELIEIAKKVTDSYGWSFRISTNGPGKYENCTKNVYSLDINNDSNFGLWLSKNIYTLFSREKRVPKFILNSNKKVKRAFFDGYYLADGRKSGHETYDLKGFTTKSATLCLGLLTLVKSFSKQIPKVKCEYKEGKRYYYACFTSPTDTEKGKHLIKEKNEIIKILDTKSEDGWFFDLQTESKTFATGANLVKIHNSERRGIEFVTRKITNAVANIFCGTQTKLYLGNLESKRDWGYSKDYVEAMWLMLQQDKPDTYVIGTDETHTIREFCDIAFKAVNLDYRDYVEVDPEFFRPAEVDILISDTTKARTKLGWKSKTSFKELVELMVSYDIHYGEIR